MNKVLNPQIVEQNLARELQRRKLEDEAKIKEKQKIIDESEEIKNLKHKFETAKLNKERLDQMEEHKLRQIKNIQIESEVENSIFQKRKNEMNADLQHRQNMLDQRKNNKKVQELQMLEKLQLQDESKEQYLREKSQIDDIINNIMEEDRQTNQNKLHKKQLCQEAMVQSKKEKDDKIQKEKAKEKYESDLYLAFIKEKEIIAQQIQQKKIQDSAQKEAVHKQLFINEEKRRKDIEEYENLKNELYIAQFEQNERKKAQDEEEKRQYVRQQLQEAERVAREHKQRIQQEEQIMEKEFRQKMMQQFAEYEKLEQMSVQKKRLKEIEHKKEVERLWSIRLKIYKDEKDKEKHIDQQKKDLNIKKEQIIQEEKERLIKEYGTQYDGFLPKFTFQNQYEANLAQQR